jgi:hypothetical protein
MIILEKWTRQIIVLMLGVLATTIVVYAAGTKRPNEACTADDECRAGHCYTKKTDSNQVCVDCSPSEISNYRNDVTAWCKGPQRACKESQTWEVAESYYTSRIEAGEKCVNARTVENKECWAGGDASHDDTVGAARIAQEVLNSCINDYNGHQNKNTIYTCTDSTYASLAASERSSCRDYGNACSSMSMDSAQVDCREIEKAMAKPGNCISAIQKLESDCLPRLSSRRQDVLDPAKAAYDNCKEILSFKKENGLCK